MREGGGWLQRVQRIHTEKYELVTGLTGKILSATE